MGPGVVIALFGPTGVGKTDVAMEVAARLGVRVISCDSMQLYRGFSVLTNQPTPSERARVPHALVGVTDPAEEWSAVAYGEAARTLIDEDLARTGWALISGGTGLYLRATLAPLASPPAAGDPALRRQLEERGLREGPEALHAELAAADLEAAARIHPRNLRRVVRALEVVTVAGGPVWSGRDDLWRPEFAYPTLLVGMTREREELNARIGRRAAAMLRQGAVEEVRCHRDASGRIGPVDCGNAGRGIEKAIGYREICLYLDGQQTEEETVAALAAATRRYAKRQLTWMRKLEDAVIMAASRREPGELASDIVRRAWLVARDALVEGGEAGSAVRVAKWHGLGNDYLIVEAHDLPAPLTPETTSLLCDRHRGVGADGILVRDRPTGAVPDAVARMRIFNPDGSEPEMCGNGIRMFARYLQKVGAVVDEEFVVETLAGPIRPKLLADHLVRTHMGRARFHSENIDAAEKGLLEFVDHELEAQGDRYRFTFVDVGNPHCIIVVDDVHDLPLEIVGPVIERLPLFPYRVNVEFIQTEADGSVTMRVWERGVGETQACGTGATAVAVAAVRLGLAQSPVLVHLEGGDLEIEVEPDWQVVMTGPAEEVFEGRLSAELMARLGWSSPASESTDRAKEE